MSVKQLKFGSGTSAYISMMIGAISPVQFIRELVVNMFQAGASQGVISFMKHKVPGSKKQANKMTFTDNGCGMNEEEIERYVGTFAETSGTLASGLNHGIGAKVATAGANPEGVVYESWCDESDPREEGNMVTFEYDASEGEYGLAERFEEDGEPVYVEAPFLSKGTFKNRFPKNSQGEVKRGTTVTLMGNSPDQDTVKAPKDFKPTHTKGKVTGEAALSWLHNVIAWKFFSLPTDFTLRIRRPNSEGTKIVTHPNGGLGSYLQENCEHHGSAEIPTTTGGTLHWWLLRDEKRDRGNGEKKNGKTADPRFTGVSRGFGLLYRHSKDDFVEIYGPILDIGFIRDFGFTHLAKRMFYMYEPHNAVPDEKRLQLVDKSSGLNLHDSGDVKEVQQWFSQDAEKPQVLIDAESAEIEGSDYDKVTQAKIESWIKKSSSRLPFPKGVVFSKSGKLGEETGTGGVKEATKRNPPRDLGETRQGSDNVGGGDSTNCPGPTNLGGPGTNKPPKRRRVSNRRGIPIDETDVELMSNREFDPDGTNPGAASYSPTAGKLCINRGYFVLDELAKVVGNVKNVSDEMIDAAIQNAVARRLLLMVYALKQLSAIGGGYGGTFRDGGWTRSALTAAIECSRDDILGEMKRNLGRYQDKNPLNDGDA